MDLEIRPFHLKLCRIPLPPPSLWNKDVQIIVLWKKAIIKKQNSAKRLSDCQCKFPFVFWIKMGITWSPSILCSFTERPKLMMKTYVLTLKILFLPLPLYLVIFVGKFWKGPHPHPPLKKFKFYIQITFLSWKWSQRQQNIFMAS